VERLRFLSRFPMKGPLHRIGEGHDPNGSLPHREPVDRLGLAVFDRRDLGAA
jgi:hypothetical protein